jgi:hypothetical protein
MVAHDKASKWKGKREVELEVGVDGWVEVECGRGRKG